MAARVKVGEEVDRDKLLRKLVDIQYTRNDMAFQRGTYRVRGDTLEIIPAYEELAFLTDSLPPKERAAVVLRYGYDLDYDQIAAALDSSTVAARQAASAGVRRLRKGER